MGTLTDFKKKKAAMVQTILFDRQGCQVMEYWIYATNRWGQTQVTGWAGKRTAAAREMKSASRRV